jgi:hypothetical protein
MESDVGTMRGTLATTSLRTAVPSALSNRAHNTSSLKLIAR